MNITGLSNCTTHVSDILTSIKMLKYVILVEISCNYVVTPITLSPLSPESPIYSTLRDLQADMITLTPLQLMCLK